MATKKQYVIKINKYCYEIISLVAEIVAIFPSVPEDTPLDKILVKPRYNTKITAGKYTS